MNILDVHMGGRIANSQNHQHSARAGRKRFHTHLFQPPEPFSILGTSNSQSTYFVQISIERIYDENRDEGTSLTGIQDCVLFLVHFDPMCEEFFIPLKGGGISAWRSSPRLLQSEVLFT